MPLNFTAIDVETANRTRRSVCAVGVTRVRDGVIVDRLNTLVCPPDGPDSFEPMNMSVHGITPDMVRHQPPWDEVLFTVLDFVGQDKLIAHNAAFDRSVIRSASEAVGYPLTDMPFICTLQASRAILSLASYSLPVVVGELGLPPFDHHDAAADSDAAALVALALVERSGLAAVADLAGLSRQTRRRHGARHVGTTAEDLFAVAEVGSLEGERVCFTGTLSTMKRDVARSLVRKLGGIVASDVTKSTTLVVSGTVDPRTLRPGATLSTKLQKAFAYAAAGQQIAVMSEAEFLERLNITADKLTSVQERDLARRRG